MGEAYYCDRCGEYGDSPAKRVWDFVGGNGTPPYPQALEDDYYLCKQCADDFEVFMTNE